MMTRKDYVATANILKKYNTEISLDVFADLVDDFSFMFEKDNPNFDEIKFIAACGGNNDNE